MEEYRMNYLIIYLSNKINKGFTWSLHYDLQHYEEVLHRQIKVKGMKLVDFIRYKNYVVSIIDMED